MIRYDCHRPRTLLLTGAVLLALLWTPAAFAGTTSGPDVTVASLGSVSTYGTSGDLVGYSVGTTSCNIGSEPVWWCNDFGDPFCEVDQHPVIAQNLYRLSDVVGLPEASRFEQIGMSWLKHGFLSTNSGGSNSGCGAGTCVQPPHGGDQLGLGCLDTYGSGLNGSRPLGLRSEVDATLGTFPYPYTEVGTGAVVDQRVQVLTSEVDPALNPGALYWVEGHYIAADDAAADNSLNNASYRAAVVGGSPGYNLSVTGSTIRERSAIEVWPVIDSDVTLVNVDILKGKITTRFHVARKIVTGGPEGWHYEYAVHNMNSDRAGGSFTVDFGGPATISGAGFRDVPHHSGEPYAVDDWPVSIDEVAGTITWTTLDPHAVDPNANALRWGTMFSFWFDSNLGPDEIDSHVLGMFAPGFPGSVNFSMAHPFIFVDGFETGDTTAWQ